MISCLRKQENALNAIARPDAFRLHLGPIIILKDIIQELLDFINFWCAKGLIVNRIALMQKAWSLIPHLEMKSEEHAVMMSISHFMAKHCLIHHMATHKAQHHSRQ
jgi:hypothetical protein